MCCVSGISFSLQSTVVGFQPQSRYGTTKDRVLKSKVFDLLTANSTQSKAFNASLNYATPIVLRNCRATRDCQGAVVPCVASSLSYEEMSYRNTILAPRTADLVFSQQSLSQAA